MTEKEKLLALARARARRAESGGIVNKKGLTGFMGGVEQLGAGLNTGIASFAGAPVDMMTSLLNGMVQRPKFEDATDYSPAIVGAVQMSASPDGVSPGISAPVGGSQMFMDAMDPLISDRAPDGVVERYMRRIGEEVGFGVPAAFTGASLTRFGAPAREALTPFMATSAAGDVGAAVAGQTAREVAPDSATADIIASMIGGGAGAGAASRMTPALAATPSLDDLKIKESKNWDKVKAAPETLTDAATAGLDVRVRNSLPPSQLAKEAYPKAFGIADTMGTLKNPRIYDVEEARRIVGDRVASDPAESRVGMGIKKEIEAYLAGLTPNDLQGGTADDTIDALTTARKTTHQVKKAEAIINKEMRGETRAATTGTGGNEVNATKQNIRAIFDKERDPTLKGARQGYTPDEMAAMDEVVRGSGASNAARLFGRLSPTSGALGLTGGFGGAGGITAGLAIGNPLLALAAVPPIVGMAAKNSAESMTKGQIEKLLKTILNGGKAPGMSTSRAASNRAVIEQLLSSAAAGNPQ